MSLFDQISEDIKKAMLAKDKVALDALRGIKKEFLIKILVFFVEKTICFWL